MNVFLGKLSGLFHFLLGGPITHQQQLILLGLGLLSGLVIFGRMSAVADVPRTGVGVIVSVYLLGLALVTIGMVLADQYVIGALIPMGRTLGALLAMVVVSLAVVVPMICLLQKCYYVSGSFTWFTALLVSIFIMVIARTGFEMVESGGKSADKVQKRHAEVQGLIQGAE